MSTILSFDQSTRISGWCLFDDNKYKDSGVIDLHLIKDTEQRSKEMGFELCKKIDEMHPDVIIIENVQNQSNTDTVIKLSRIQGMLIGYAYAHNIESHVIGPSEWRKALGYKQGRGVERKELKQQSLDYVKKHLGFEFSEDRAEACCINMAAQKIYDFDKVIWD